MKFITRSVDPRAAWALENKGVHPLLAQLYSARGVQNPLDLDDSLASLSAPDSLLGIDQAADLLSCAIDQNLHLCIVADYDCDGATACAVAIRGLRLLGAKHVSYVVPDRMRDGYGLTPQIAQRVKQRGADVLITVDNGIASIEGVQVAKDLGLKVLITDHHLSVKQINSENILHEILPLADALVNPNQVQCTFPSKALAGVGVIFYVLLALRAKRRQMGVFTAQTQPKLDTLLPLVALGTVADVVKLDANNRRLVSQGLKRMRQHQMPVGMASLLQIAGRRIEHVSTFDLGFLIGPRVNAAGRLADMTVGIECLITDDAIKAQSLAHELDHINRERREIEGNMREQANEYVQRIMGQTGELPSALSVYGDDFHEGVVGIVAGRLKETLHRPVFVFAPNVVDGKVVELKGSGRSITGFHMRDALDLLAKRHDDVLLRFGGHAMAAGCTIDATKFEVFKQAFETIADEWLTQEMLQKGLLTDGALRAQYRRVDVAQFINAQVWGQGFAAPIFSEPLQITSQRLVGDGKHSALKLLHQGQEVEAIWFGCTQSLPKEAVFAFRLDTDEWQGRIKLKFIIEAMMGAD